MLKSVTILLLFQCAGEVIAYYTGWPVPGAVLGMILLLATLLVRGAPSTALRQTSDFLIRHLALLFLPAGVGIFFLPPEFSAQLPALLSAVVLGTVIALAGTAWVLQALARRQAPDETGGA